MRILDLARRGYKSGGSPIPDGAAPWWHSQLQPGSDIDYKTDIGNPMTNSIVAACMGFLVDNWAQSPAVMFNTVEEGKEPVMERKHRLLELLDHPNDMYGGSLFRDAIVQDIKIDGTAFAYVEYGRNDLPVALYWLPTEAVRAEYTPGREWIRYWEYNNGAQTLRYAPEEVIVWREGHDKSTGGRRGFSRFRAAIAEVYGDNEARNTVNTIMRNRAQMGTVITPSERFVAEAIKHKADPNWRPLSKEAAELLESKTNTKFSQDGRGRTAVFNTPMTVTEFGSVLQHLDSQKIRSLPETRVPAVFGLPSVVINLLVGLQASSDKNNIQFAHKMAWMNGLIPLQDRYAGPINELLLPLTELKSDRYRYGFDRSGVEALQEDATEKSGRVIAQWKENAITHDEMRTELGLEIDPALKGKYYRDLQAETAEHAASLQAPVDAAKELIGRKWRERG